MYIGHRSMDHAIIQYIRYACAMCWRGDFFSCKGLMACLEPREFVSIRNDLGRVSGPLPGVGEGKSGFILSFFLQTKY